MAASILDGNRIAGEIRAEVAAEAKSIQFWPAVVEYITPNPRETFRPGVRSCTNAWAVTPASKLLTWPSPKAVPELPNVTTPATLGGV